MSDEFLMANAPSEHPAAHASAVSSENLANLLQAAQIPKT